MDRPDRGTPLDSSQALAIVMDLSSNPMARDIAIWRVLGYSEVDDDLRTHWSTTPRGPKCISNGRDLNAAAELFPEDLQGLVSSWHIPSLTQSIDASLALVRRHLGDESVLEMLKKAATAASKTEDIPLYVIRLLLELTSKEA